MAFLPIAVVGEDVRRTATLSGCGKVILRLESADDQGKYKAILEGFAIERGVLSSGEEVGLLVPPGALRVVVELVASGKVLSQELQVVSGVDLICAF